MIKLRIKIIETGHRVKDRLDQWILGPLESRDYFQPMLADKTR